MIQGIKEVDFEFSDVANIEEIEKNLSKFKEFQENRHPKISNFPPKICILIDGMTTLLLPKENSKNLIINLFKTMKDVSQIGKGNPIIFSNYIQSKYEIGHQEVYNHGTYFSQLNSTYITSRFYTERIEQK